jgi:uncharacterized protein
MHPFVLALGGGVLIGLAGALLLLTHGRVAGISGIAAGVLTPARGEFAWRAAFVAGLVGGGFLLRGFAPESIGAPVAGGFGFAIAAGLLVGFGTRLGNGCTSGHGVCGLARGSGRSLAATLTFMATAAITVFLVRHAFGAA